MLIYETGEVILSKGSYNSLRTDNIEISYSRVVLTRES